MPATTPCTKSVCAYSLVLALSFVFWSPPAKAAEFDEVGRFYLESFLPRDYGASEQNWSLVEDGRGFLYVANSDGVLEYDGVNWRLIPTLNRSIVRSLAIDSTGRILGCV